jgi:hypothetical protein
MIPSQQQIDAIPKARCGEFELNDKEAQTLRSRLYSINKDGIRRYRTMRDGPYIVVWRMK